MRRESQDVGYTLSRYVLTAELPNGALRVFSTLWGSVVDLDPHYQQLVCGETSASTQDELKHLHKLEELGILVQKDVDEANRAVEEIERRKHHGNLTITYCVTSKCNFRCVYCVQEGKYGPAADMPPEIRHKAVDFACRMLAHQGRGSSEYNLDVVFYGGEPLLNYDGMLDIMVQLHSRSKAEGIKGISFGVVTNGSLLDLGRLELLRSLGLQYIQITVDGLPSTHNMRRQTSTGSWGSVWETILAASSQGIHSTVNVVVDNHNVDELPVLLDVADRIAEKIPELKSTVTWIFGMLIPTRAAFNRCHHVLFGHEAKIFAQIMDAYILTKERGWRGVHPLVQAIDSRESYRSFAIAPDGTVYKCFGTIGMHDYSIGTVWQEVEEVEAAGQRFTDQNAWDDECLACSIFPLCRGGCQAIAALDHGGEFGHKLCEREFRITNFQRVLPAIF